MVTYAERCRSNECTEYLFDGVTRHEQITLQIWDTPCIDGWTEQKTASRENKRAEVYPRADFILLCFSVSCPTSLANAQKKVVSTPA